MGGIIGYKCKTRYCRNQVYYGKEYCDECMGEEE